MFDELFRSLRKYERGVKIPVGVPLDEERHYDRLCPSAECMAAFKVHFDDWKEKVRDELVYCPICRYEAPSGKWNTPEQAEYFRRTAISHVREDVSEALVSTARRFNASQPRDGFIQMSMAYRPGPKPVLVPLESADTLRQRFKCEACDCRYSSLGAAFFCPACGHNSAASTIAAALNAVRVSVCHLDRIRDALESAADADAAADTARQILENGLVKLISSFQRYAEATFQQLPAAASHRVRKNLFQNLGESTALWRSVTGTGYENLLTSIEYQELSVFFQQRHLLAHKEGLIDQEYIDKSSDSSYSIGQKLQVKAPAVLKLAEIIEKLVTGLKARIAAGVPTSP